MPPAGIRQFFSSTFQELKTVYLPEFLLKKSRSERLQSLQDRAVKNAFEEYRKDTRGKVGPEAQIHYEKLRRRINEINSKYGNTHSR